jgi:glucokinase
VIAIDVGGSSTKSAVVSRDLDILTPVINTPLNSAGTADEIIGTLAGTINRHLAESDAIQGVSFGFPGPFEYDKGICRVFGLTKFEAIYGYHIPTSLEPLLTRAALPMRFQNDADVAIFGEVKYGVGRSYQRVIGLTLGTGLGSGFMADGKLITDGPDVPAGGEVFPLFFEGQGSDDLFSTRGLLARFRQNGVEVRDVASAVRNIDQYGAPVTAAFEDFGRGLGQFLEPLVENFRAEAVVMLGGIAQASDYFVPAMQQTLSIPLLRGELGSRAPILGLTDLFFNDPPEPLRSASANAVE